MEQNQMVNNIHGVAGPSMPNLYDLDLNLDLASSQELQLQLSQVTQNLNILTQSPHQGTIIEKHLTVDEGLRHLYINDKNHGQAKQIVRTNPIKRQIELTGLIGKYKLCKPTRTGGLLLEVITFQQVQQVLKMESLMGIPVKTVLSLDIGTCKGYAHEPRLMDTSTDQLKELWSDHHVIKVDRKRKNGKEAYNASLFITFKADKFQKSLPIGDEWVRVQKWKPKVKQCTKCNGLYHNASNCKAVQLCAECGKDHIGVCVSPKYCVNCKTSGHGSKDPDCPILKRENAIIALRREHKIGYMRAKDVYNRKHKSRSNQGQNNSIDRSKFKFRRKQPNSKQIPHSKTTNSAPISLVGQSWQEPKIGHARKTENTIKSQGGPKHFPKKSSVKHQTSTSNFGAVETPQNNSGEISESPKIHSSQIAGSSKMDIPWVAPKTKSKSKKPTNKNMQNKYGEVPIKLHNTFENLENLESECDSDGEQENTSNQFLAQKQTRVNNKKRPSPISPSCERKRAKITPKTTPKASEVETLQPELKNIVGSKTNKNSKTNNKIKDSVSKSTVEVDFENVDDILKHLGQHIDKSSNLMFIVKLLGALLSKISKGTINEAKLIQLLTSSKDNEIIRP